MLLYHGSSTAIKHPDVTFNTGFADLGQGFYLTDDLEAARSRAQSRARVDSADCGVVSAFEFNEDALAWAIWGDILRAPRREDEPMPEAKRKPTPEARPKLASKAAGVQPSEVGREPAPEATSGPAPETTSGPAPEATSGPAPEAANDPAPQAAFGLGPAANSPVPAAGEPFGLRFEASVAGIAAWANYIRSCRKGATAAPGLGEPAVVRAWIANDDVEMVCSGFAPAEALAEFIDPAELIVQYCFRDQPTLDRLLAFAGAEFVK